MKIAAVELPDSNYCLGKAEFCCSQMDSAWGDFIGFGEKYTLGENKDNEVNIYTACRGQWGEGILWRSMPIKYCPWCMADIRIEIVKD